MKIFNVLAPKYDWYEYSYVTHSTKTKENFITDCEEVVKSDEFLLAWKNERFPEGEEDGDDYQDVFVRLMKLFLLERGLQ